MKKKRRKKKKLLPLKVYPVTLILVHVHFFFLTFCDLKKVAAEYTWHLKDRTSLPGVGGWGGGLVPSK